jgi:hypothetical protein
MCTNAPLRRGAARVRTSSVPCEEVLHRGDRRRGRFLHQPVAGVRHIDFPIRFLLNHAEPAAVATDVPQASLRIDDHFADRI